MRLLRTKKSGLRSNKTSGSIVTCIGGFFTHLTCPHWHDDEYWRSRYSLIHVWVEKDHVSRRLWLNSVLLLIEREKRQFVFRASGIWFMDGWAGRSLIGTWRLLAS